jgi:hypothetical protein
MGEVGEGGMGVEGSDDASRRAPLTCPSGILSPYCARGEGISFALVGDILSFTRCHSQQPTSIVSDICRSVANNVFIIFEALQWILIATRSANKARLKKSALPRHIDVPPANQSH